MKKFVICFPEEGVLGISDAPSTPWDSGIGAYKERSESALYC